MRLTTKLMRAGLILTLLLIVNVSMAQAGKPVFTLEIIEDYKSTNVPSPSNMEGADFNTYFDAIETETLELEKKELLKNTLKGWVQESFHNSLKNTFITNAFEKLTNGTASFVAPYTNDLKNKPDYTIELTISYETIKKINADTVILKEYFKKVSFLVKEMSSFIGKEVIKETGSLEKVLSNFHHKSHGLSFTGSIFNKYNDEQQVKILNYFKTDAIIEKDYPNFSINRLAFALPFMHDDEIRTEDKIKLRSKDVRNPIVHNETDPNNIFIERQERFTMGVHSTVKLVDKKLSGKKTIKVKETTYRAFVYDLDKMKKYTGLEKHVGKLIQYNKFEAMKNYIKLCEKN